MPKNKVLIAVGVIILTWFAIAYIKMINLVDEVTLPNYPHAHAICGEMILIEAGHELDEEIPEFLELVSERCTE